MSAVDDAHDTVGEQRFAEDGAREPHPGQDQVQLAVGEVVDDPLVPRQESHRGRRRPGEDPRADRDSEGRHRVVAASQPELAGLGGRVEGAAEEHRLQLGDDVPQLAPDRLSRRCQHVAVPGAHQQVVVEQAAQPGE